MRESFFGLNIAVRGLYTAQKSLNVVNHNLNNTNTPGYSRQVAVQTASRPMAIFDGTGMLGTGADITSIQRVRDEYLDFKFWSENVSLGEWSSKAELLSEIEVTFNEPSESGFTKILSEFYNSLQDLSKDPGSAAARTIVKQRAITTAKFFNSTAAHFEKMQSDVNYRVKTKVEETNSLATQIQQLNRQIYTAELDGSMANDLRDKRTVLVDRMSKIINIDVNEVVYGKLPDGRDDKHFVITISGKDIIDHFNMSKLEYVQRETKLNDEDITGLDEIRWADGNSLNITGGEIKGYIDIRDGNGGENGSPIYKGIPYYQGMMNQFVRNFAMAVNEGFIDSNGDGSIDPSEDNIGHADGFGLIPVGGSIVDASEDIRLFTILNQNGQMIDSSEFIDGETDASGIYSRYDLLTAKNFSISKDVYEDTDKIATTDVAGEIGNIIVVNSILSMRHNKDMFAEGAPEDYMKSLISTLAVDTQQANRYTQNQQAIVHQIENRRHSISGVSIDEEMTNLVKFQHAYNASAKMIQTMSEVYDTLINKLGV